MITLFGLLLKGEPFTVVRMHNLCGGPLISIVYKPMAYEFRTRACALKLFYGSKHKFSVLKGELSIFLQPAQVVCESLDFLSDAHCY